MKNTLSLLSLVLAFTWLSSCNSESEPTVQTLDASNITGSEATTGGTVTEDGGAEVIGRGVVWNTLPQPNLNNSFTSDGAGLGSFASAISNLKPNTQYYVRAYATNAVGTAYGNEVTFTTTNVPTESVPTLSTLEITNITGTTASSGGTITNDGSSGVTARGLCWNTLPAPNINNTSTSNGTGTGSFTSEITALDRNTKYYVRAYATNATGTGYGNEIEFTTSSSIEIKVGSVTYMMHEDATFSSTWGPLQNVGATSGADGKANTEKMAKLSAPNAAKKCAQLNTLGYNDWYLPGIDEIAQIHKADSSIWPIALGAMWSSTEISEETASYFLFDSPWGGSGGIENYKLNDGQCVCVRVKE